MAPDALEALRGECELVSQRAIGMQEEEFGLPTRLPAWNVKQLLAHMYRDIDRTNTALDSTEPPAADGDSVSYWRSYDPSVDSSAIAGRAVDLASAFDSGHALAQAWDEMWRRALGRAAGADRSRFVATWGPALTLDQYLRTRVLEITVHRMDLNHALGLPPDPTEDGLTIVTEILLGLLDQSPPAEIPTDWDAATFIEKGTGRSPLSDEERTRLGALAARFPLLA